MKFTRVVYVVAAVYGFATLLPLYFLLERFGRDAPPPVTHPELYYGFIGLALLWQVVFLLVARDPVRYRPVMLLTILEKLVYSVPVMILYSVGRVDRSIFGPSMVDPAFGILFLVAYWRSRATSAEEPPG